MEDDVQPLNAKTENNIKIGLIGGTGLDNPKILNDYQELEMETPFGKTSAPLIAGKIAGVELVILARHGRKHEIMPTKVPYLANLWALKEAGCTHILATTACGSLKQELRPGEFVFIDQFIDFTKHRTLTIFEDKVVHTAMAEPFCPQLRKLLTETAQEMALIHHTKGTMITIEGPRFSTRAESHLFRTFGADTINMSTVPEVIIARELGICYAAIGMVTDYDSWKEGEDPVTWSMIVKRVEENSDKVKELLLRTLPKVNFTGCTHCK
jgi:5'-methylthioadenosine phosphorylase